MPLGAFAAACLLTAVEVACSSGSSTSGAADARADASARDAPVDRGALDAARDRADSMRSGDGGIPTLTALAVRAQGGSPPLGLVPPFSSSVHDYYVRCGAGANALTVSMTASAGASSLLVRPAPSPSLPAQTVSLEVYESEAIVAVAMNATASTEYWVRCLPHDFPRLQWSLHAEAGSPPPGYYMVGGDGSGAGGYAMVLDGNGVPVWYTPTFGSGFVEQTLAGTISVTGSSASAFFDIHQLGPPVTTQVTAAPYPPDRHDLRLLPDGNLVTISYPLKTGIDLTGFFLRQTDGGLEALGKNSTIQDCLLIEVTTGGTVQWTWAASDHFNPISDSDVVAPGFRQSYGPGGPDAGPVYDPFHCNSVDVDPANGNLLVSIAFMSSVVYVERPSGRVLWKMGGKTYSVDDATFVTVDDPFYHQHDARLIGWSPSCNGGTGQVSVFDDEERKPVPARAVLYDVVVGGDAGLSACDGGSAEGGARGARLAWQYKGAISSADQGSFRLSADGSRVVGWGVGAPNLVFTEVDSAGHDLLDLLYPSGGTSYRAVKVPLGALDLNAMRSTAGQP